jgi:hypothetical protein
MSNLSIAVLGNFSHYIYTLALLHENLICFIYNLIAVVFMCILIPLILTLCINLKQSDSLCRQKRSLSPIADLILQGCIHNLKD